MPVCFETDFAFLALFPSRLPKHAPSEGHAAALHDKEIRNNSNFIIFLIFLNGFGAPQITRISTSYAWTQALASPRVASRYAAVTVWMRPA